MNIVAYNTLFKSYYALPCQYGSHRGFAVVGRHSKNVALKKNKIDAAKMKLYNRIAIKITMAAKAGSHDSKVNMLLQRALKEAQAIKLPKDNIDRAIKKASATGDDYVTGVYELYGYGGVGIVVSTLTDNSNRAVKEIKRVAKDADVKFANSGSVLFNFIQQGIIKLPLSSSYTEDSMLEAMLAHDVEILDIKAVSSSTSEDNDVNDENLIDMMIISTAPDALGLAQDVVEQLKLEEGMLASVEYVASEVVTVNDDVYERNMKFVEELEKLDDVDKVYHNMDAI